MKKIFALMVAAMLVMTGCSDDKDKYDAGEHEVVTYKVAVFSKPEQKDWMMQTIGWAQSILKRAQVNQRHEIKLEFDWLDQTASNMDAALTRIAEGEYVAVLGPSDVKEAKMLLTSSELNGKTVILPMIGSSELQRIYADWENVFFMTQSDVMQNEILLNLARENFDTQQLALVSSDDGYGETFREWFGFQAEEMGSTVNSVQLLDKEMTVRKVVESYQKRHVEAHNNQSIVDSEELTFFFPSSSKELLELDRVLTEMENTQWGSFAETKFWAKNTACSDRCVDYDIASQVKHRFFGVEPAPLPESGFAAAYEAKYGKYPKNGTAQTFDTVYLLTYALSIMDSEHKKNTDELWKYIVEVIDGEDMHRFGWQAADVEQNINLLRSGERPFIKGVSSTWSFDKRFHCAPISTTYRYWLLSDGKYGTVSYVSANGNSAGTSSIDIWNLNKLRSVDLKDTDDVLQYGSLKDKYAVIVAASTGWNNYRHQADAMAMYHLLRRHGYDDKHIILIMEDDIANNPENPRGEVRVEIDGENLYNDTVRNAIDYKLSKLNYEDLINIMAGNPSEKTPVVLQSDSLDNVLFFWSGHGNSGTLYMNETKFPALAVKRMLDTMKANGKFRKMFFVIEACYSGSVAQTCEGEGRKGVLFLTAANASETSKADILDKNLGKHGTYLSNGFTRGFLQMIDEKPGVDLSELYYFVASQTVGSHARMYNIQNFGSVHKTSMEEFLRIDKSNKK